MLLALWQFGIFNQFSGGSKLYNDLNLYFQEATIPVKVKQTISLLNDWNIELLIDWDDDNIPFI